MTPNEWRLACPSGGGPYTCPCCHLLTLDARGDFEICDECGWEDDGQDDPHADETWGGPNGSLSLSDARASYRQLSQAETIPLQWRTAVRACGGLQLRNSGRTIPSSTEDSDVHVTAKLDEPP